MNAHSTRRLTCWTLKMLEYTFDISYFSGKGQVHVDSLSRNAFQKGTNKDEEKSLDLVVHDPELAPLIKELESPSRIQSKLSREASNYFLQDNILYKSNPRPEGV
ncbi:hypothetical protein PR048_013258 [Dryococelus australis]|uniref:Uncharacterized protein n=1 Tax=Dryococelus australis TaxID=614101 RepID=A0ABQ9HRM8_9NEOP|nr:hypothetical protein PR048_013258 [Dryococelus australis]